MKLWKNVEQFKLLAPFTLIFLASRVGGVRIPHKVGSMRSSDYSKDIWGLFDIDGHLRLYRYLRFDVKFCICDYAVK